MTRIALGLEYNGMAFHGWQSQAGGGTVQDALESALKSVAAERIGTFCAGRTDAGVHANLQVVHFDTLAERPLTAWVRGVNAMLPESVAVRWAQVVPEDFHARFCAYARRYRYLLINRPQRPGLWRGRCGWFHLPLELEKMQQAAVALVGEHDFTSFRAAACQAKSPVKLMRRAEVRQQGNLFIFEFEASAFLHHMVRNLVGSLVYIGKGAQPVGWIAELLETRDRRQAGLTFAPDGLYFCGPVYEERWGLPSVPADFLEGIAP